MKREYKAGDVVLGNWTLVRKIGEGSFGKVFEAERRDYGITYKAAIKLISIPQDPGEVDNAKAEGMDDASVRSYFESMVQDIVQEFALMSKLKGISNVVSYEDHSVIPHEDGFGWDILIRMELLSPLTGVIASSGLSRRDVVKLGIDICHALELCQKYNIIHRDIKPENIFVSQLGDYKLGDFGIARTLEKTSGGLSKKGTYTYMAPEVYREDSYGSNVDIYSLGIVLYRLLNNNRAPFLPAYPAPITYSDRETALMKRISGAQIPPPANAPGRMGEIVLKACAYNPKERYFSPSAMRQDLEAILLSEEEARNVPGDSAAVVDKGHGQTPSDSLRKINIEPSGEDERTWIDDNPTYIEAEDKGGKAAEVKQAEPEKQPEIQSVKQLVNTVDDPPRSKLPLIIGIAAVLLAALAAVIVFTSRSGGKAEAPESPEVETVEAAEAAEKSYTPREMRDIGYKYYYKYGDYEQARLWFEKAVEQDDAESMAALGEMYYYGFGVEKDYARALELYERSVEGGSYQGMQNLADYYYLGDAEEPDYELAFELYSKASRHGYEWSDYHLGEMYMDGTAGTKDLEKAIELMEAAAKRGVNEAMLRLAEEYYYGTNIRADLEKAGYWAQMALDNGRPEAQYILDNVG